MKRIFQIISIVSLLVFTAACSSANKTAERPAPNINLQKVETGKQILVVYYSKTGNTERVARDIAGSLGADIEKLLDKKERTGCLNYLIAGKDSMRENATEIEPENFDASKFDIVIMGSPVWSWNMTPAIRTYIENNKGKFKQVAFFVTSGNTDMKEVLPYLETISGKKAVASTGFNSKELKDDALYAQKITKFLESFAGKSR
ncbi:MAG: hypothetical protein EPN93_15590 [Spirochaetes bacterium]|nr:MAG: hypothetical protein EPN93_15590 [Spirochaetota bacterium]